jgi:hypothetical protein
VGVKHFFFVPPENDRDKTLLRENGTTLLQFGQLFIQKYVEKWLSERSSPALPLELALLYNSPKTGLEVFESASLHSNTPHNEAANQQQPGSLKT